MATLKPDNALFCCSLKMVERGFGKMREARLAKSCDIISYLTYSEKLRSLQLRSLPAVPRMTSFEMYLLRRTLPAL